MSGLFNYDNKVFSALDKIINLFYISILWVIFSIPIFTIGASTTALYYTVHKVLRHNRGYVFSEFWHSFKANFKQATILWIIVGGIALIVGKVDIGMWLSKNPAMPFGLVWLKNVFWVLFIMVLILDVALSIYIFPYLARFENTNKQIIKNVAIIACVNFPYTVVLLIMLAVSAFLIWTVLPLMIFLPALCILGMNYILEKIFRKYMTDEQCKTEDEANEEYHNHYR
jgi:uncharacterized membrane protein YesL